MDPGAAAVGVPQSASWSAALLISPVTARFSTSILSVARLTTVGSRLNPEDGRNRNGDGRNHQLGSGRMDERGAA